MSLFLFICRGTDLVSRLGYLLAVDTFLHLTFAWRLLLFLSTGLPLSAFRSCFLGFFGLRVKFLLYSDHFEMAFALQVLGHCLASLQLSFADFTILRLFFSFLHRGCLCRLLLLRFLCLNSFLRFTAVQLLHHHVDDVVFRVFMVRDHFEPESLVEALAAWVRRHTVYLGAECVDFVPAHASFQVRVKHRANPQVLVVVINHDPINIHEIVVALARMPQVVFRIVVDTLALGHQERHNHPLILHYESVRSSGKQVFELLLGHFPYSLDVRVVQFPDL